MDRLLHNCVVQVKQDTEAQGRALHRAINSFYTYLGYAANGSHCAVPGETDSILEQMEKIYEEYFGSKE